MLAAAAAKPDVEPSETGGDGSCSSSSSGARRRLLGEMEPLRASCSEVGSDNAEAGTAGVGIVEGVEDDVASVLGRGGGGMRRDGIVLEVTSADEIVGESSETPPNAVAAPKVGDSIGRS